MVDQPLQGLRILVVEDEYLLADDLCDTLIQAGADVLGPYARVAAAEAMIAGESRVDAALLDVNLGGEMVFPLADALAERGIPFAFTTGYDRWAFPERFLQMPRIEKPFHVQQLTALLKPLIDAAGST